MITKPLVGLAFWLFLLPVSLPGAPLSADGICQRYFKLHLDTSWTYRDFSREEARQVIQESCAEQLAMLQEMFGAEKVKQTVATIARRNGVLDHKIPILFSGTTSHPHIMNPGNPYSGVFISAFLLPGFPGYRESVEELFRHEMAHLLVGKFNDSLTETIANLFKRNPREVTGDLSVLRALTVASALDEDKTILGCFPSMSYVVPLCDRCDTCGTSAGATWRGMRSATSKAVFFRFCRRNHR